MTAAMARSGLKLRATWMAALALIAGQSCGAAPVAAAPASAPPLSVPPPSVEGRRLDAALARVSRAPRSVDALLEAGNAASANGNDDAALGFFRRAEEVAPNDARVLTGFAGALLRDNDAIAALPLYSRAERTAPLAPAALGDRGLAYDLVGDNARAQRAYRQALVLTEDHEITRRLALSQAIGGDVRTAEVTLRPLLQEQDKAGWRTRAFIYAIGGRVDEAVTVARTLLPSDLAEAITPYLRFMPRLTRAQQAAAANLGVFPQAAAIGRDDSRIERYDASAGGEVVASVDTGLVPAGAPLGRRGPSPLSRDAESARTRSRAELAAERASRVAPPELPAASRSTSPATDPRLAGPPALSGVRVPQLAAIAQGAPGRRGVPEPSSGPQTAARPSLAEAFGDIGAPDVPAAPRAGVVDVTRLALPRAPRTASAATAKIVSAKPVRPPAPSHPSRIWVQLGVGHDHAAMAADWRRMIAHDGSLLKGHQPFVSDDGARKRMLTGPFDSNAAARDFVQQLSAAGMPGPYVWVSPAGQVVDPLAAR
jgi:Flp pilus assembly protein TadD